MALIPIGTVLGTDILMCKASISPALSKDQLNLICPQPDIKVSNENTDNETSLPQPIDRQAELTNNKKRLTEIAELAAQIKPKSGADEGLPSDDQANADKPAKLDDTETTLLRLRNLDPQTPEELMARLSAIKDLEAKILAPDTAVELAQHKHYRAVVYFLSAAFAYIAWSLASLTAQITVVSRQWKNVTGNKESLIWQVPVWVTLIASFLAAVLMFILVHLFLYLPGSLDKGGFPAPILWALVGTQLFAMIFVTGWGVTAFAHNYPPARKAQEIRSKLTAFQIDRPNDSHVQIIADQLKEKLAKNPLTADTRGSERGVKTSRTQSAKNLMQAINSLCLALALSMIITLVFVTLGFDVLEVNLAERGDLRAAVIASSDAWILCLGVGMSISLFVLYIYGAARLLPYVEATSGKSSSKNTGWTITGALTNRITLFDNVALVAKELKPEDPEELITTDMAILIGADQNKLELILAGCVNGGGFHGALNDSVIKQIFQLLTLLAPALAGGALAVLG
ncbi:hypothetical protein N9M66_02925 [Litoreibacter sp.]|nr:hypothetical protein [Litoreibacter sp.]